MHDCPGGCGTLVPYEWEPCVDCWRQLPPGLGLKLTRAFHRRFSDPDTYHVATVAAALWLWTH